MARQLEAHTAAAEEQRQYAETAEADAGELRQRLAKAEERLKARRALPGAAQGALSSSAALAPHAAGNGLHSPCTNAASLDICRTPTTTKSI